MQQVEIPRQTAVFLSFVLSLKRHNLCSLCCLFLVAPCCSKERLYFSLCDVVRLSVCPSMAVFSNEIVRKQSFFLFFDFCLSNFATQKLGSAYEQFAKTHEFVEGQNAASVKKE